MKTDQQILAKILANLIINDCKGLEKKYNRPMDEFLRSGELTLIAIGIQRNLITKQHGRNMIKELAEARCR